MNISIVPRDVINWMLIRSSHRPKQTKKKPNQVRKCSTIFATSHARTLEVGGAISWRHTEEIERADRCPQIVVINVVVVVVGTPPPITTLRRGGWLSLVSARSGSVGSTGSTAPDLGVESRWVEQRKSRCASSWSCRWKREGEPKPVESSLLGGWPLLVVVVLVVVVIFANAPATANRTWGYIGTNRAERRHRRRMFSEWVICEADLVPAAAATFAKKKRTK